MEQRHGLAEFVQFAAAPGAFGQVLIEQLLLRSRQAAVNGIGHPLSYFFAEHSTPSRFNFSFSRARPLAMRDLTVPSEHLSAVAISS